jgi:hypothetical protein
VSRPLAGSAIFKKRPTCLRVAASAKAGKSGNYETLGNNNRIFRVLMEAYQ